MNKRILSLLLALMMVVITVVPAFAADATAAEAEAEAAEEMPSVNLEFARAMGLLNPDIPGSTPFTRAELAKLVVTILLNDVDIDSFEVTNNFSDVEGEMAAYISAAVDMKIMNGHGDGTFGPNERVTYIQLLKTMVCLLGRSAIAESRGGYPSGYYVAASQLDLTHNAPDNIDSEVTYSGVADVLKYMVEVNVARLNSRFELEVIKQNYLEYYLDICRVSGIVEAIGGYSLDGARIEPDRIMINGKRFAAETEIIENHQLFGLSVDGYYEKEQIKTEKLFYVEARENDVLEIDAEDLVGVSNNEIIYNTGRKNETAKFSLETIVIKNEEVLGNYNEQTFMSFMDQTPGGTNNKDGKIVLYAADDDSVYDIVKIYAYDTYIVSRIEDGKVYNKYHGDYILDLESLEEGQLVNVLNQPISKDLLKKGDVISVMKDSAGKETRVIVTIESYTGTVAGIKNSTDNASRVEEILIDDMWFKMSYSFLNSPNKKDLEIGKKILMYFNPEGRVCDLEVVESASASKVGYLITSREEGTFTKSVFVKLLTAGGDIQTYELSEKIKFQVGNNDETAVNKAKVAENFYDKAKLGANGKVVRQPILYKLDDDNKINWIRFVDETAPATGKKETADGFYRYEGGAAIKGFLRNGNISGKILVSGSTVIFSVPPDDDTQNLYSDNAYEVITTSKLGVDSNHKPIYAYGVKVNNPTAAIGVVKETGSTKTLPDYRNELIVIKDIYDTVAEDGTQITEVVGIQLGKEVTVKILQNKAKGLQVGDIIQCGGEIEGIVQEFFTMFKKSNADKGDAFNPEVDGMGLLIDGITKITNNPFDIRNNSTTAEDAPTMDGKYRRIVYGKVFYKDASGLTIRWKKNPADEGKLESHSLGSYKIVLVDSTGQKTEVSMGNTDMILSEVDNGAENASRVVIHAQNMTPKVIVIYK